MNSSLLWTLLTVRKGLSTPSLLFLLFNWEYNIFLYDSLNKILHEFQNEKSVFVLLSSFYYLEYKVENMYLLKQIMV